MFIIWANNCTFYLIDADEQLFEPQPWDLVPIVKQQPVLNIEPLAVNRDLKPVHLLPPTCSVLTDEEDADDDETCSFVSQAPTFSHFRDALVRVLCYKMWPTFFV